MKPIEQQLEVSEQNLEEATEEVIKLKSQLTLQAEGHTTFVGLIHILPYNELLILPIPDSLTEKAKLVESLRQATARILETMK